MIQQFESPGIFKVFDTDGDGKLNKSEIYYWGQATKDLRKKKILKYLAGVTDDDLLESDEMIDLYTSYYQKKDHPLPRWVTR